MRVNVRVAVAVEGAAFVGGVVAVGFGLVALGVAVEGDAFVGGVVAVVLGLVALGVAEAGAPFAFVAVDETVGVTVTTTCRGNPCICPEPCPERSEGLSKDGCPPFDKGRAGVGSASFPPFDKGRARVGSVPPSNKAKQSKMRRAQTFNKPNAKASSFRAIATSRQADITCPFYYPYYQLYQTVLTKN